MPGGIARHQFLAKSGKRARQVVERQAGEEHHKRVILGSATLLVSLPQRSTETEYPDGSISIDAQKHGRTQ
jgi:hypothetical protein